MLIECPASLVKEIDRRYRMNDRILRHQTVRVQHESQLEPSPIMKSRANEREERAAETASASPPNVLSPSEGEMNHA
jgi:hypothetical protein